MALMTISGKAHALDGGILSPFHFGLHWPAASDVVRSVAARRLCKNF